MKLLLGCMSIVFVFGCSDEAMQAPPPPMTPPPAIDPAAVQMATGGTPQVLGNVVRVNFPRADIPVTVDGWTNFPPFIGLTSYAAFTPDANAGTPATVAGDIVLFQDEVNPVISAAINNGLEVTALHNHFF